MAQILSYALSLFLCFILFYPSAAFAEPLPVEAFGMLPQAEQVKLSPNGTKLALILHSKGSTYIGVKDVKGDETKYILSTDNQKFKIGWFVWANNDLLLVSGNYPMKNWPVKYTETRLIKIRVDGTGEPQTIMKPKRGEINPQFQHSIIDLLPDEPDFILMELSLQVSNRPDVYKVNLNLERDRKIIQRMRLHIEGWMVDQQHRVRLGFGRDDTGIFYILYDLASKKWRKIWQYEIFDAPDITPLGFGLNPSELYLRAIHNGRYAIFKVDVTDKNLAKELIYADENYDIEGSLIYSNKTRDVIGVYHGKASNAKVYFDPAYEQFQASLNKALPDAFNNAVSFSKDETKYVLFTSNPQTPGAYYLGDRTNKTLDFISDEYPLLSGQTLSERNKIHYKARDGLDIEAYVTLPYKNVESKKAALVIPHGGPMARNYDGFDWFSQFFASRGYTVIEPNFRGSSGYGFEFEMASIQKWGGAMQDDLADAASWLTENYSIDKERVCILGASYGGYAAMMAAVKQQELFRCALSFAGVSDLEYIVRKARGFNNHKVVEKQLGNDFDTLKKNSPINFAKQIDIPLLLVHGEDDRSVDAYHSREMFARLRKLGKSVKYIELENGNHYLEIERNRLEVLDSFDKFLSQHLD